jgi:hypothetical protein
VRLDDHLGDRQAKAASPTVAGATRVGPVKAVEHALELLGWNARPVVAHGDLDPAGRVVTSTRTSPPSPATGPHGSRIEVDLYCLIVFLGTYGDCRGLSGP